MLRLYGTTRSNRWSHLLAQGAHSNALPVLRLALQHGDGVESKGGDQGRAPRKACAARHQSGLPCATVQAGWPDGPLSRANREEESTAGLLVCLFCTPHREQPQALAAAASMSMPPPCYRGWHFSGCSLHHRQQLLGPAADLLLAWAKPQRTGPLKWPRWHASLGGMGLQGLIGALLLLLGAAAGQRSSGGHMAVMQQAVTCSGQQGGAEAQINCRQQQGLMTQEVAGQQGCRLG